MSRAGASGLDSHLIAEINVFLEIAPTSDDPQHTSERILKGLMSDSLEANGDDLQHILFETSSKGYC